MEVAAAVSGGGGSSSSLLLPDEMIMEILLRLPVKPILRFRTVCRSWAAFISTEEFCSLHMATAAAKIEPPPQKLLFLSPAAARSTSTEVYSRRCCSPASVSSVPNHDELLCTIDSAWDNSVQVLTPASCRGLTLLYDAVAPAYYVCNASTRAVTRLPPCSHVHVSRCSTGLGFDARTRKYKVVRLITETSFDAKMIIRCEVYTHGGGGHGDRRWRPAAGEVPLELRMYAASAVLNSAANNVPPVFSSNGFLHWLVNPSRFAGPPSACTAAVVSFSLADETFSSVIPPLFWTSGYTLPLPTYTYRLNRKGEHLVDMDNQLCMVRVIRSSNPDGGCALEIWKSPDCGSSSQSHEWSMKHRIDLSAPDFLQPLVVRVVGSTGNGSGSSGKKKKEKKVIIATTTKHMISKTFETKVHTYDLSSQALETILSVTDQINTPSMAPSSRFGLFEESLACIN